MGDRKFLQDKSLNLLNTIDEATLKYYIKEGATAAELVDEAKEKCDKFLRDFCDKVDDAELAVQANWDFEAKCKEYATAFNNLIDAYAKTNGTKELENLKINENNPEVRVMEFLETLKDLASITGVIRSMKDNNIYR